MSNYSFRDILEVFAEASRPKNLDMLIPRNNLKWDGFHLIGTRAEDAARAERPHLDSGRTEKHKVYFFMRDVRQNLREQLKQIFPSPWRKLVMACDPLQVGQSVLVEKPATLANKNFRTSLYLSLAGYKQTRLSKFSIKLQSSGLYEVTRVGSWERGGSLR